MSAQITTNTQSGDVAATPAAGREGGGGVVGARVSVERLGQRRSVSGCCWNVNANAVGAGHSVRRQLVRRHSERTDVRLQIQFVERRNRKLGVLKRSEERERERDRGKQGKRRERVREQRKREDRHRK